VVVVIIITAITAVTAVIRDHHVDPTTMPSHKMDIPTTAIAVRRIFPIA
jgi:hypothetical protein